MQPGDKVTMGHGGEILTVKSVAGDGKHADLVDDNGKIYSSAPVRFLINVSGERNVLYDYDIPLTSKLQVKNFAWKPVEEISFTFSDVDRWDHCQWKGDARKLIVATIKDQSYVIFRSHQTPQAQEILRRISKDLPCKYIG